MNKKQLYIYKQLSEAVALVSAQEPMSVPEITEPAAAGMAVLMVGAVAMHLKVHDPLIRALPASTMLALSLFVVLA